jgi:hypothetical protein
MLTACVFVTRDTVVIRGALCSENLFVNRIVHDPRRSWTEVRMYFSKIHFNIILPPTPSLTCILFLLSCLCAANLIPSTWSFCLAKRQLYEAPHHSFLRPLIVSFLSSPNILLSTVLSDTLIPCFSLNVRDLVLHPYKSKGKIIVLYILIFKFLDSRRDD